MSKIKLKDIICEVKGYQTKVNKEFWLKSGDLPVISQDSTNTINNFVNKKDFLPITELPLIIFGDHTCVFKYVDFEFVRGADGTQLIKLNKNYNTKFIYYLLQSLKSEIPDLNKYQRHYKYLKELDISNSSFTLLTQQKIAHILSTLDAKIELNNKINSELEAMAKTIYDYWFVQFDFADENGNPYKSSGGAMVWNEELKREIPKGWEVKKLGEIEKIIVTGKTPPTGDTTNFDGTIPFITIGDIRDKTHIIETVNYLSIKGANLQRNKFIPKGSLCVTCIATVGLVGLTTQDSQTNQQINSIVFEKSQNRYYLYFTLISFFKFSSGAKIGNTFANMNKEDFGSILTLYPKQKVLIKFMAEIENYFNLILNKQLQSQNLSQLRDWLLPMLMNGQVEVEN